MGIYIIMGTCLTRFSNHQEQEEIDPNLKKKLCAEVRRLLNDESKVSFDISTRPLKYI